MKIKSLLFVATAFFFLPVGYAQQPAFQGEFKELYAGPASSSDREEWLTNMKQWRTDELKRLDYHDSEYARPELSWLRKSFIYVQAMAHDRYLYDPVAGKYTVDRYLNDLKTRYGGIDAILIWPTYPNIGIDNRNQFDLVQYMPGGIKKIRQMILDFKSRGVRVFFPIMIWDHGTRKIGLSMPVAIIKEMKTLGASGLNGDTMWGVTEDFRNAYDSLDHPVVLQPELAIRNLKGIEWNTSSWGYYWDYQFAPGISVYKWLEPRHQVFVTNRWATDKTDDLQYAFFNGIGYNAWENIWGIWNQVSDRYAEEIRRISAIYREFSGIWNSAEWEPYIPTIQNGIFASRFGGADKEVYTMVNRDSADRSGGQLKLPYREHVLYYDLWNGVLLTPEKRDHEVILNFSIEARGFGAVLAIRNNSADPSLKAFLYKMHVLAGKSLKSFSTDWRPLPQIMVPVKRTDLKASGHDGMLLIPAVKNYAFESNGVMIEGDPLPAAVGIQHSWETHPARTQKHEMEVPAFYIDQYPVTNKAFKKFVDEAHYRPKDTINFLKDWKDGNYPQGWDDKPVTWVSIEDARNYAAWAGKRLPHEWEWQYAAQGTDNRLYPWGNEMDAARMPSLDTGRTMRPPTDVNAYPQGASPFKVMDMVGNIWQWTDEYRDAHTCAAVLKGGGYYRSTGSNWYFPRACELNKYGKYLLMAPSLDRSGAIGFRCVKDE